MISSRRICVLRKLFRTFDKRLLATSLVWEKSVGLARNGYTSNFRTRLLSFLELPREYDDNDPALVTGQERRVASSTSHTSLQNDFNSNLSNMIATEFEALILSIKELPQCALTNASLTQIDRDCCKILRKLSHSQVLQLLCVLAKYHPGPVTYLKFYKVSLPALRKVLEDRKLNVQEMLQLLFLEGLMKKSGSHKVKYTMTFLPPIRYLSLMEQCIVALVAFKCAVKLKDVQSIYDTVEDNAGMLVRDPAVLVTFCKALRLSGLPSDCSLSNLSAAIINNTSTFSIRGASHVLCLYAEAKVDSPGVLQRLFDYSMEDLVENTGRQWLVGVMIKDVNLLLWASSTLNYNLRSSDTAEIISFIDRRYNSLSVDPIKFANILLCLWIMNCRLKDVMVKCLKDRVFMPILKEEQVLWKPRARLQLLLSCTRIEAPEIALPDEIMQPHKVGVKIRKCIVRLSRMIEALAGQLEIDDVNIDCPVDGIYIPGVSFKLKKGTSVHVDVLDQTVCLRHTTVPFGLLNLKLRLLPKIGIFSLVITEPEITNAEAASSVERCIKILYNKC